MKQYWLRMIEKKVLRKILWFKTEELTGDCKILCSEVLNDFYSSPILSGLSNQEEGDGQGILH